MSLIDEVMTVSEAAKKWGISADTLKTACQRGRFTEEEARKSAGTWLVTYAGVKRLYGDISQES